ncbi:hypothetical protein [Laceyella putida]|uniref:FbpB family small basic protein n=1 Tax=Laceyella putida TaxID=110101 RepID=A0ABW2RM37_9BACL
MSKCFRFFLQSMSMNREAQFLKDLHAQETVKKAQKKRNHLRRVK